MTYISIMDIEILKYLMSKRTSSIQYFKQSRFDGKKEKRFFYKTSCFTDKD